MAKIWKQEPAWLEKKRQLAVLLQSRFPTLPTQEEWGDSWQKGTTGMSRGWLSLQEDSLTAMPLEEAVNEYSTLLQENLMEKAIFWQDSQLAAMHLANIDCGQFICVHRLFGSVQLFMVPTLILLTPIILLSSARELT